MKEASDLTGLMARYQAGDGDALAGLYAFTCALQGYMENPVGLPIRLLLLVLALALLKPSTLAIQGLALGCLLLVLVINIRKSGRSAQRSAAR